MLINAIINEYPELCRSGDGVSYIVTENTLKTILKEGGDSLIQLGDDMISKLAESLELNDVLGVK